MHHVWAHLRGTDWDHFWCDRQPCFYTWAVLISFMPAAGLRLAPTSELKRTVDDVLPRMWQVTGDQSGAG